MASCCEHFNEPSGSIKFAKLVEELISVTRNNMLLGGIWLLILDVAFVLEYYVSQCQTLHGFRHAPFIQLG